MKLLSLSPDILFSVDSPDFTLRVAERVKKINSKIKISSLCSSTSMGMERG